MVEFKREFDVEIISNFYETPWVLTDTQSTNNGFVPVENTAYFWAFSNNEKCGFFRFKGFNDITVEIHPVIFPAFRGKTAKEVVKAAIDHIAKISDAKKVIAYIPESRKSAIWFARSMGFEREGVLKKSHEFDGNLYDIHVLTRSV